LFSVLVHQIDGVLTATEVGVAGTLELGQDALGTADHLNRHRIGFGARGARVVEQDPVLSRAPWQASEFAARA
jgi:hypothetical protein